MSRRVALVGLAGYLAVLAALTLGPSPGGWFVRGARAAHRIAGLGWVGPDDVERAANVLFFVPGGLLLCAALPWVARLRIWLLWLGLSVAVEVVQVVLPGRQPSLLDVVLNGLGAGIGVLAHVALSRWRRR